MSVKGEEINTCVNVTPTLQKIVKACVCAWPNAVASRNVISFDGFYCN